MKAWGRARVVAAEPALVSELAQPADLGRIEQVVFVDVDAWDVNCPRHIARRVSAAEAERRVEELRVRIADLEAENRRLAARGSGR